MKLQFGKEAVTAEQGHADGEAVKFSIADTQSSIPARFEKIAETYPQRLAVKTDDRSLNYAELNRAANRACGHGAVRQSQRPRGDFSQSSG